MAKKKTVKKPRRRLKKAVRRSLAAVLMVTAIVVAAIPVPENLAVNPREGETGTTESPVAYVPGNPSGSTNNPYVLPKPESEYQSEAELSAARAQVNARIAQDIGGPLVPTEIVTRYGGELYLTWQFLYESTGNKTGRLLKYNDEFPAELVNLGLQPNAAYFAIHENAYNLYFTNPEFLNKDVGPNNEPKSTIRLSTTDMDNLNPGSLFYPTASVDYTYHDMNRQTGEPDGIDSTVLEFFQNYFPQDFASATANFKAYWDEYNRVQQEGGDVNSIEKPGALSKRPCDITNENDRKKFFCEHSRTLSSLPNYTLEIASDRRLNAGGDRVYLAHGDGNVPADSSYKDVDGYLVQKDDTLITTIAYRAFADVHNVKQIQIDQYVRTIERSAFEKADIASVDIGNARTIGDRAFANCKSLTKVSFNETAPTDTIGVEAFYGSGINAKVEFPRHISSIGHGAFANCLDLSEVQFYETGDNCTVGDYAFYGDTRLTSMDFARTVFDRIGKCAFAIAAPSGDAMTDFHFPSEGLEAMDDYILGNRQGLKNVYFENYTKKVPLHTFYNCFNLLRVEFSDKCGGASFDSELFKDVTTKAGTGDNPEAGFCVYGPENYNNSPALPRVSTWDAVRTDGEGVTYVYESGGKKYYEVALDSDGTRYRYAASEDGVLISCALISRTSDPIDLVIPEMIGDIKVNSIGPGCFDDKDLRALIRSITIKNRSITTIGEGVFKDLPRLEKVRIGDSVASIGANAFAGCKNLENVYFTKPTAGYEAFEIGENAFVTTGNKLTFHGDIVVGYAPFEWATDPANVLRDQDSANLPPVNVCYQSLWDSETGTHLTVMPDKDTGEVTLLDYPKFKDLDKDTLRMDDELADFCTDMEEYYYYTVYNNNNDAYINEMRTEYAYIFEAWRQNTDENIRVESVTLPDGEVINAGERNAGYVAAMDLRDGPWINPVYCSGSWKDYLTTSGGTDTDTAGGLISDFLFEPLVAEAAVDPEPYFDRHPYNFMENYELEQDPEVDPASLQEYQRVPEKAWGFINATRDIYVPEGVESIDAVAYKDRNIDNYNKYIASRSIKTMYERKLNGATPGLFSGYFKDYDADDDDRETEPRGNDTVQSIVLTAIKEIPDYAFDSCEQLTRVEIPAAAKVGSLPFRDCGRLVNLVGSDAYPAERGILYEKHKDADGNDRYRIIECLLARGRSNSGNEELAVGTVSSATDSLIPFLCETCETDIRDTERNITIPAIAEGAFEGCKDIFSIDLVDAQMLKTIPENCFKDCDNLQQVVLPGSVNKIADGAFQRADSTARADVTIYGREVDIADTAFMPDTGYHFTLWSYLDSAAKRFTDRHTGIQFKELGAYRVWFYDYDGTPLAGPLTIQQGVSIREDELPESLAQVTEAGHRPGYTFDGWMTDEGKTLADPIEKDMTIFVAQYKSDGTMVDGKYSVQFVHGRTGQALIGFGADTSGRYLIVPNTAFTDPVNATANGDILQPPAAVPSPTEDGYVFLNEYRTDSGAVWTPDSIIERNTTVLALFGQSGGNGDSSGGSTNTSNGSSNTSRNSTSSRNSSSNRSSNSTSSSSSSTSSSSTSATSTTSSGVGQYTVFVDGGSGSGSYAPGTTVIISAYVPAEGMRFNNWTTQSNGVTLASTTMSTTTFTMPANNVTVKANYVEGTPTTPAVPNTGGGSGTGNNNGNGNSNGNTRVDIEKPGISNRDLATAVTNGSTDNFIVKITETDEATRAVAAALTNKYGTLDNILYYAMDISLYDSTGTTKITDTTGLSVDITIPIPDSLVAYGGNNMAGAVVNGDQLESLNESFTTINGVPCIRFRATHFSPYTVYVDTGNLVEGMLDTTPKTGDPIHPKWFLSLGLACLSIILFMKKDKKSAVKVKA